MKRLLFLLSLMASLLSANRALAQTGLKVNDLFEGRVIPQERMVETRVRGKSLEKYQLTYYRSLRLKVTNDEAGQLRQLLGQDADRSIDMQTSRKNPHRWDTWTCKLQMPSAGSTNRFLCFQEVWNKEHDECEVTIIYMEGVVDNLEELEKLLK